MVGKKPGGRKKATLHSECEFIFFFFLMWVKDKFTKPGKILKEFKIVLVGFFLFTDYRRIIGFGKIQKVTIAQKTKLPTFFPQCIYPEDINFAKY